MKKGFLLAAVVVLVLGTSPGWAFDIAGFGSYMSTSDLSDSFGLGAKASFNMGQTPLFLEGRASYYPQLEQNVLDQTFEIKATPLELGVGAGFGNLFASTGLTYFVLDPERGSMDNSAGFYLSGGFRRSIQGIGFYADAIYRILSSTVEVKEDEVTIARKDVDLNGFGINLGITITF